MFHEEVWEWDGSTLCVSAREWIVCLQSVARHSAFADALDHFLLHQNGLGRLSPNNDRYVDLLPNHDISATKQDNGALLWLLLAEAALGAVSSKGNGLLECLRLLLVRADPRQRLVWSGKEGHPDHDLTDGGHQAGQKEEYDAYWGILAEEGDWSSEDVLTPEHHQSARHVWEFRLLLYGARVHAGRRSVRLSLGEGLQSGRRQSQRNRMATGKRNQVPPQLWHRAPRPKTWEYHDDRHHQQISAQTCRLRSR